MDLDYNATIGYYVVESNDTWVYDVDIFLGDELIAVVGFSPRQKTGALYWQAEFKNIIEFNYSSERILEIARDYRDTKRPVALCEK